MRCPVCLDQELHVTVRDGIETDHCPRCRGIWLDRGELDKLMDLAESRQAAGWAPSAVRTPGGDRSRDLREPPSQDRRPDDRYRDDRYRDDRDRDHRYGDDRPAPRRKKRGGLASLLEDVFEGFD